MTPSFDPYSEWLGIDHNRRPPTHYSMLGIREGESRGAVIEEHAQRQKQKLQQHLHGPNARLAKRLLFEIEGARSCLLDAGTKAAYDRSLQSLGGKAPGTRPGPRGPAQRAEQPPSIPSFPAPRTHGDARARGTVYPSPQRPKPLVQPVHPGEVRTPVRPAAMRPPALHTPAPPLMAPNWLHVLLAFASLTVVVSGVALWLGSRGGTDLANKGDKPAVTARQRNRPVDKPDEQSAKPADAPEEPPAEKDVKPPPDDPVVQPKEPVEAPTPEESAEPPEPTVPPPTEGHPSEEPAKQPDPKQAMTEPEGTGDPRPTLSFAAGIVPEEAECDEDGWYTIGGPRLLQEGAQIQLGLIGPDKLFLSETVLEPVTVRGEGDANARQWHLMVKNSGLATFALQDQHLRFKWGEQVPAVFEPRSLRNCLLLVTDRSNDHQIAVITLRKPITAEKVPALGFLDRKGVSLPVEITDLPESLYDQLRWEFVPGTVGGGNGLPEVTIAQPDQPQPGSEPNQPPSGNVFSVTIPGEEPIKVTAKDIKVVAGRTGLALSFVPQMESSVQINPPWAKATATPLEKGRIHTLRGQAEKQLKNTENELRNRYIIRDLENPTPLLKHNSETLQAKQKRQQQLAGEKRTPEKRSELSKLANEVDYLQGLVQRLELIIEVRSYLNRLERLEEGFDLLGRVYVGYRIYLPFSEDGDEPLLLVEGVKDPLEAKPHGAGKEALVADPGEAATAPPAAGSNDEAGKPPAADSGTKNDQPDSPKLFEEGE